MRISGGKARGIQLQCPDFGDVRPAIDALREAIFSSLGELVLHQQFIDLFAGTGAYGLETLSRGATGGIFVEKNRRLRPILWGNLQQVAKSVPLDANCSRIYFSDAFQWQWNPAPLLFLDPPYPVARERIGDCFELIERLLSPNKNARAVLEIPSDLQPEIPATLRCLRRLGKTRGKNSPQALILARSFCAEENSAEK